MKVIHIADLHFGKNLYGYSLIDNGDQPYWSDRFFELVEKEEPDVIVIAGDVYDRGVPPKEAVNLLDSFLTRLVGYRIPVMMIAGNHDSGTRLSFGADLLKENNLYIAGEVQKEVMHQTVSDEYGEVTFWLVPYLFPAAVREVLGDESISNYDQAMRALLKKQEIDFTGRNVIVSHQMVTNGGAPIETEGSETMVGGVGNIDVSCFDGFDYAALGHIHAAQAIGKEHIRYSGSPLCYHFSETRRASKGPVIVELKEKGEISIRVETLPVLHEMREVKGNYSDIYREESLNDRCGEYIRVVLTDDLVPVDAVQSLAELFRKKESYLMETSHEPKNALHRAEAGISQGVEQKAVGELFTEFYRERNEDAFPGLEEQKIIAFLQEQVDHADEDEKPEEPKEEDIEKLIAFVMEMEEKG